MYHCCGTTNSRHLRNLKKALQTTPVLRHYYDETEINTDATSTGLDVVLVEKQDVAERAMAYTSRTLTKVGLFYYRKRITRSHLGFQKV